MIKITAKEVCDQINAMDANVEAIVYGPNDDRVEIVGQSDNGTWWGWIGSPEEAQASIGRYMADEKPFVVRRGAGKDNRQSAQEIVNGLLNKKFENTN